MFVSGEGIEKKAIAEKLGLTDKHFEKELDKVKQDFNEDLLRTRKEEIKKLEELKMVEIKDGFLKITEDFFYVSNSIIVELM